YEALTSRSRRSSATSNRAYAAVTLATVPPLVRFTLPTRTCMVLPPTQCRAVSTHRGAMIEPEQVNDPSRNTATAQGAEETVLPPMICMELSGLASLGVMAWAVLGAISAPVRATASSARIRRTRMGDSFQCRPGVSGSGTRPAVGGTAEMGNGTSGFRRRRPDVEPTH